MPRKLSDREKERIHQEHWSWIWFIALAALAGMTLGVITVVVLLQFDINGLGTMVARSSDRLIVTALLAGGFASTFGMIAMGIAIMIRSSWPTRED